MSRVVGQIAKGDIAGEIALITEQDRTATLTALRDCELFRLPQELFTQVNLVVTVPAAYSDGEVDAIDNGIRQKDDGL